jgi:hypothetical protein
VGSESGDTGQILAIGSERIDACERVTIDLVTRGGAPATELTPTQVEILADVDIVRVSFDTRVQASALADSVLEGSVTDRAYVVRGLDGQLFVDITVLRPVEVAVVAEETPARLHLELRAGPERDVASPSASANIVVLSPQAGGIEFPLTIDGYSRTGSGSVRARLMPRSGEPAEKNTTAAAYVETWGAFRITFDEALDGPLELLVAGPDPADGPGVALSLEAR